MEKYSATEKMIAYIRADVSKLSLPELFQLNELILGDLIANTQRAKPTCVMGVDKTAQNRQSMPCKQWKLGLQCDFFHDYRCSEVKCGFVWHGIPLP
jgi:hypothetical protein